MRISLRNTRVVINRQVRRTILKITVNLRFITTRKGIVDVDTLRNLINGINGRFPILLEMETVFTEL